MQHYKFRSSKLGNLFVKFYNFTVFCQHLQNATFTAHSRFYINLNPKTTTVTSAPRSVRVFRAVAHPALARISSVTHTSTAGLPFSTARAHARNTRQEILVTLLVPTARLVHVSALPALVRCFVAHQAVQLTEPTLAIFAALLVLVPAVLARVFDAVHLTKARHAVRKVQPVCVGAAWRVDPTASLAFAFVADGIPCTVLFVLVCIEAAAVAVFVTLGATPLYAFSRGKAKVVFVAVVVAVRNVA